MNDGVNIFVAGQTGSGKSELVKRSIVTCPRLITYLPKAEDTGYPGVYFNGRLGEKNQMLRWWDYVNDRCGRWRIVYRPANKFDGNEFDAFARWVHAISDCTVLAEECGDYLKSSMFQAVDRFQGIRDLLCTGRTRGITAYWIHQRPAGIPPEVKTESRDAYLFYLQGEQDRDSVKGLFGLEAYLKVCQLQPQTYQHVHWVNTGKVEVGKA
jgi:hypothetical protein